MTNKIPELTINLKEKLIKKHLGIATPDWIVQNCIKMLNEFEELALTIPVVVGQSKQLLLDKCPNKDNAEPCRNGGICPDCSK